VTLKLKLNVFYAENFLGLSIDRVNGSYTLPVTSYYLWPRTNAWEQIKLELDSKPWIDNTEKVKILNDTVEIMDYWRENNSTQNIALIKTKFPNLNCINVL